VKLVLVTTRGQVREITDGFMGGNIVIRTPRPFPSDPNDEVFGVADVELIGLIPDDVSAADVASGELGTYVEEVVIRADGTHVPLAEAGIPAWADMSKYNVAKVLRHGPPPKPKKPKTPAKAGK